MKSDIKSNANSSLSVMISLKAWFLIEARNTESSERNSLKKRITKNARDVIRNDEKLSLSSWH